jgi:hypothetical protein
MRYYLRARDSWRRPAAEKLFALFVAQVLYYNIALIHAFN